MIWIGLALLILFVWMLKRKKQFTLELYCDYCEKLTPHSFHYDFYLCRCGAPTLLDYDGPIIDKEEGRENNDWR